MGEGGSGFPVIITAPNLYLNPESSCGGHLEEGISSIKDERGKKSSFSHLLLLLPLIIIFEPANHLTSYNKDSTDLDGLQHRNYLPVVQHMWVLLYKKHGHLRTTGKCMTVWCETVPLSDGSGS